MESTALESNTAEQFFEERIAPSRKRKRRSPAKENRAPSAGPDCALSTTLSNADIARAWLIDNYTESDHSPASVPRQQVYSSYSSYCEANSFTSIACRSFGKIVWKLFPDIHVKRLGSRAVSTYHYCGITYKTAFERDRVELFELERKRAKLVYADNLETAFKSEKADEKVEEVDTTEEAGEAGIDATNEQSEVTATDLLLLKDITLSPTLTDQLPLYADIMSEYLIWLHASHCELIVRCMRVSQFGIIEDELRKFWVAGRMPLNCNSFIGDRSFDVFLVAETRAYQDAVVFLQTQLTYPLSSQRLDTLINFIESLKYIHRNTICFDDNMRGSLGYFIHLMTGYVELAKMTRIINDVFHDSSLVSAMATIWTDSLRYYFNCNNDFILAYLYGFGDVLTNMHTNPTSSLIAFTDTLLNSLPVDFNTSLKCSIVRQMLENLTLNNDAHAKYFYHLRIWFDDYLGMVALRDMEF